MFGEEGIPEYEINSQTVELLYQMARENEEKERQAELLIADLQQKTEEYTAESEERSSLVPDASLLHREGCVAFCSSSWSQGLGMKLGERS